VRPSLRYRGESLRAALTSPRGIIGVAIVINIVFWIVQTIVEWWVYGLFYVLGVDWSRFWGAARAFTHAGPRFGYDLMSIANHMQPIAAFYDHSVSNLALKVGPAPYPPIFLALFTPFTWPPPTIGFLLWVVFNVALGFPVARSLASHFPSDQRRLMTALLLLFYPFVMALFVGQMVVILLFAFWKGYEALRRGEDFRAGAWFGVMLIKPQYAAVLLLVLLAKRRWNAIAGNIATGFGILVSSLAVGGISGVIAYVRMILIDYPNYSGGLAITPQGMISWRALVLNMEPDVSKIPGLVLTGILSLISLAMLAVIWRGEWNPRIPRFHQQMMATMLVSLLVAYHSQVHGAVLLMVPGAFIAAHESSESFVKKVMVVSVFAPPFVVALSAIVQGNAGMISLLFIPLMTIALIAIFKNDWYSNQNAGRLRSRLGNLVPIGRDTPI